MSEQLRIMIVAGEASGDAHAAKLVRALRGERPSTTFFGSAGPKMRDESVEAIVQSDELAVVGLLEIASALPMFISSFRKLTHAAQARKPDLVILVDFPDFNLRLARSLKKMGLTIVYYISPQLWAWRKYRVEIIRKYVDLVLTILPFEKQWYERRGVENVEYVGSPLAREVHASRDKNEFCRDHGLEPQKPMIALLPGSRRKEITRILPTMFDTMSEIAQQRGDIQFVIALARDSDEALAKSVIDGDTRTLPETIRVVTNETYDALNASDAAAVTSGTATLEAGILNAPMVVVYRTSALNYSLLEPIINVPHYGLINLIAGKAIAKELIQQDFTPKALAEELLRLLQPQVNASVRAELQAAADKLGHGGASKRAAEAILNLIDN
jgi:lipid-A-disaccharide synthase